MGLKIKLTLKGETFVPSCCYGDGVQWRRGRLLGKGGFASVFLATLRESQQSQSVLPSYMAVKSAEVRQSSSLKEEQQVLAALAACANVIHCFGEETTTGSDGTMAYNLLLEYGSGGSLSDRIYNFGHGGLPEAEVRLYTRSILEGLVYIHEIGYVHCDLKPENILLVSRTGNGREEFVAKICDFGLAKRAREKQRRKPRSEGKIWRGTPMYLSPEAIRDGVQESPSDIWSLGCVVLEMLTGKSAWDVQDSEGDYEESVLKMIRKGLSLPKIPKELSWEARSFLSYCLRRMAQNRLPAKTLLRHPFVNVQVYHE